MPLFVLIYLLHGRWRERSGSASGISRPLTTRAFRRGFVQQHQGVLFTWTSGSSAVAIGEQPAEPDRLGGEIVSVRIALVEDAQHRSRAPRRSLWHRRSSDDSTANVDRRDSAP